MLPEESRSSQFAIRAFNLELANLADRVSEPVYGSGRITWWRENINKIYKVNTFHLASNSFF